MIMSICIKVSDSPVTLYTLFIILSFVIGFILAYINIRKCKVSKYLALCSVVASALLSLYLAFGLTLIQTGGNGYGLSSMGGAFGVLIAAFVISKVSCDTNYTVLNSYVHVLTLMYSISKLGCLFAGCCYGIEYHGLLCINYTGGLDRLPSVTVFPVQLLESAVFLIVYFILRNKGIKTTIVVSAVCKLLLDFLRNTHSEQIISANQLICLALVILLIPIKIREYKTK